MSSHDEPPEPPYAGEPTRHLSPTQRRQRFFANTQSTIADPAPSLAGPTGHVTSITEKQDALQEMMDRINERLAGGETERLVALSEGLRNSCRRIQDVMRVRCPPTPVSRPPPPRAPPAGTLASPRGQQFDAPQTPTPAQPSSLPSGSNIPLYASAAPRPSQSTPSTQTFLHLPYSPMVRAYNENREDDELTENETTEVEVEATHSILEAIGMTNVWRLLPSTDQPRRVQHGITDEMQRSIQLVVIEHYHKKKREKGWKNVEQSIPSLKEYYRCTGDEATDTSCHWTVEKTAHRACKGCSNKKRVCFRRVKECNEEYWLILPLPDSLCPEEPHDDELNSYYLVGGGTIHSVKEVWKSSSATALQSPLQ